MHRSLHFCLALMLAPFTLLVAQDSIPDTDIFLIDMMWQDGTYRFGAVQNITNRPGYDNQPCFSADGRNILYSSIREGKQSDIYRYDIQSHTTTRISNTPESEFAPIYMPDSLHYSVVRVDKKGEQRVWMSLIDQGKFTVLTDRLDSIGYHQWWNRDDLVIDFIRKKPMLEYVNMKTGREQWMSTAPGRCIQVHPTDKTITFVNKDSDTTWTICRMNEYKEITVICQTLKGEEDFAWTPHGTLLMTKGAVLYEYTPGIDKEWRSLNDFSKMGISGMYRLAISPKGDKLAVVSFKGKRP